MATGTLKKWGNSQGVIIPKLYCDEVGIKAGDKISITTDIDRIIIKPEKEFTLQALMAGYEGNKPEIVWPDSEDKPVGRELW